MFLRNAVCAFSSFLLELRLSFCKCRQICIILKTWNGLVRYVPWCKINLLFKMKAICPGSALKKNRKVMPLAIICVFYTDLISLCIKHWLPCGDYKGLSDFQIKDESLSMINTPHWHLPFLYVLEAGIKHVGSGVLEEPWRWRPGGMRDRGVGRAQAEMSTRWPMSAGWTSHTAVSYRSFKLSARLCATPDWQLQAWGWDRSLTVADTPLGRGKVRGSTRMLWEEDVRHSLDGASKGLWLLEVGTKCQASHV